MVLILGKPNKTFFVFLFSLPSALINASQRTDWTCQCMQDCNVTHVYCMHIIFAGLWRHIYFHIPCMSSLQDCDVTHVNIVCMSSSQACDDTYVYIPIAFVLMVYIVYLVECWNCRLRARLSHSVSADAVYAQIGAMTQAKPVVWWRAVCYHYVRCARQVARYRNGDALSTTQVIIFLFILILPSVFPNGEVHACTGKDAANVPQAGWCDFVWQTFTDGCPSSSNLHD